MTSMLALRLCSFGVLALGACVTDAGDDAATDDGGYLFGLTESELRAIHPLVQDQHDEAGWLALNRAPFRCDNYGDLCAMIGERATEDLTRYALFAARDGVDRAAILAEMDRRTDLAREAAEAAPELGLRVFSSETETDEYPCGNHRLRNETFKNNPVIGARYGQVVCRHQTDLGSGIWGGSNPTDEMQALVEIVGTNEDASASQTDVHRLVSPKVYPGANQIVRGECIGTHDGDVESNSVDVD